MYLLIIKTYRNAFAIQSDLPSFVKKDSLDYSAIINYLLLPFIQTSPSIGSNQYYLGIATCHYPPQFPLFIRVLVEADTKD